MCIYNVFQIELITVSHQSAAGFRRCEVSGNRKRGCLIITGAAASTACTTVVKVWILTISVMPDWRSSRMFGSRTAGRHIPEIRWWSLGCSGRGR